MLPSFRSLLVAVPAMLAFLMAIVALLPAWLPAGTNVGSPERLLPFATSGQEPESRVAQRSDELKRLLSIQFGPVRAAAHEPAVRIERMRPLTGMAIPLTPVTVQPPRRIVVASLRPYLPQELLAPVIESAEPSAAPPRVQLASLPAPAETPELDPSGPTIVARELIELPPTEEPGDPPPGTTDRAPRAVPPTAAKGGAASAAKKNPPLRESKPNAKAQRPGSSPPKSAAKPQAKASRKATKPARAAKAARPAAKRAAPQRAAQQPASAGSQQQYVFPFWDSPPAGQTRRRGRTTQDSEP